MKFNYHLGHYQSYKISIDLLEILSINGFEDYSYHNDAMPSFRKDNFVLWVDLDPRGEYREWYKEKNCYICIREHNPKESDEGELHADNMIEESEKWFDNIDQAIIEINERIIAR